MTEPWPRCSVCGRFMREERLEEADDFGYRCTQPHGGAISENYPRGRS